jgi:hypothetical protein
MHKFCKSKKTMQDNIAIYNYDFDFDFEHASKN